MRTLFSLCCLPLLLLLAGCGTPPEQRLDSPAVHISGLTATGDGHVLALDLVNSNTVPLVISRSTHTLYLGEQRIGRIDDREPVGVPPLGHVAHTVTLPAASSAQVRAWLANHPGDTRATVESALVVVVGKDDETITLTSVGRGTVKAP